MHVLGKLGFHAPSLQLHDQSRSQFSLNEVEAAYNVALKAIASLMEVANEKSMWRVSNRIRSSLISALLQHGTDDMLEVDTVQKAGLWQIDLIGAKNPTTITREMLAMACANELAWKNDQKNRTIEKEGLLRAFDEIKRLDGRMRAEVSFKGLTGKGCLIDIHLSGQNVERMAIGIWDGYSQSSSGINESDTSSSPDSVDLQKSLSIWKLYPPSTPLKSLSP
jgi:hypothetical protein